MPKKPRERRRRGDGSVTVAKRDERGRPVLWKASISLGTITIGGKRRRNRPTLYAETEAEAHQLLKQLQAKHLGGDDLTANKQTVEAFLLRWLEHTKAVLSPGGHSVYETRCRVHIIPAIGGLKLRSLKTAHCQALLDDLIARGRSPSTVKGVQRTLVRALNMARKWGEVKENVAVDTETPPEIIKRPLVLNEAQLDKLLAAIEGHPLEDIVIIALATGARIGEVLGLLWADVNYDDHELRITGAVKRNRYPKSEGGNEYRIERKYTKPKDERTQHLPDSVAAVFRRRWDRQQQARKDVGKEWKEHGLVFTDAHGYPLNPNTIGNAFTRLARDAGLPPGFSPHNLRHSAAAFLIKQRESTRTIMEVLGHKNPRTTARYGIVLEEVSREALDKHAEHLTRRRGAK